MHPLSGEPQPKDRCIRPRNPSSVLRVQHKIVKVIRRGRALSRPGVIRNLSPSGTGYNLMMKKFKISNLSLTKISNKDI